MAEMPDLQVFLFIKIKNYINNTEKLENINCLNIYYNICDKYSIMYYY